LGAKKNYRAGVIPIKIRVFCAENPMTLATRQNTWCEPFIALMLAAVIVLFAFLWQGHTGFSLWDEGFLWYGAQRVMLGEVPIQDFMAYDPGRYYWSAAFMTAVGSSGIMALRLAIDCFQVLGIFVGLLLISRTMKPYAKYSLGFLVVAGIILALWMFPRHKIFDLSLSVFLTGALSFLIAKPSHGRYFVAGLCVGLVAFFGRNHGLYGIAGSLGCLIWLSLSTTGVRGFIQSGLYWGLGVVVGFSPIYMMALFIPGFGTAFLDSVRLIFEMKTTNISLPVPWPWKVDFSSNSFVESVRQALVGVFFILLPAFGFGSVLWVTVQRFRKLSVPPAFVASAFLTLPYAHYAYSRADIGHLAQGLFPFLLACLTLISVQTSRLKWPLVLTLAASSLWIMSAYQPGAQCLDQARCVSIDISDSSLSVDSNTANDIELLRTLTSTYAANGQNILVTPFWPGAYALLNRKAPMWSIYALWPRSVEFQREEISRIQASAPAFAFVLDFALDGRDDLRFKNTYPLIYKYITDHFEKLPDSPSPAYEIYKARKENP
jgi:hypothetical protein